MTVIEHGYDWAWAQIPSSAVTSNGGTFVMRYIGGSARLTPQERDNHHAAGVNILLFFEQEADEAEKGYDRGVQCAQQANLEAGSLGYPKDCTIFFADDQNDPDPSQEVDFMRGVKATCEWPSDMYSGGNVLVALGALSEHGGVEVETWYPNAGADPCIMQLANTRDPAMVGIDQALYDTDLLLKPIPMWGPNGTVGGTVAPAPTTKDTDVVYDETTALGGHRYWIMSPNGPITLPLNLATADLYAHVTFVPVTTEEMLALIELAKPKPVPAAAPDLSAFEAKVSGWFGALQDHVDAKIAAIPASGGAALADIQKAVHTELLKLGISVTP